jgi:DNA-binding LacI/PurR family transcriptional regulator
VTAEQLTDRWIGSAKTQLASTDLAVRSAALRHALGFAAAPTPALAQPVKGARRIAVIAGSQPELETLLRKRGFDVRPVAFTPFDAAAAAKVQHFETYNRTTASQRVADIVAALHESPSAVLVANGDAALPALLAAALSPVRLVVADVGGFDTSSDAQFLDRVYIPGLRRAGDFQTAAAMARGDVIAHGAGDAFHAAGIRVEREVLTPGQIVALAIK